jgi:hypothetical protein
MSESDRQLDESQEPASPMLQRDLGALYNAETTIPPNMNERILNRARSELTASALRGRRMRILRFGAVAAAAAVILLAIWLRPSPAPGDLDGDGTVDILDALVLARRIESDQTLDVPTADLNNDGIVDRRDVDAIAARSVQLDRGRVQ